MSRGSSNPHQQIIERYAAGGPLLAYAAQGLSPEHRQARPGPGAWSIAEIVVHLLDSDLVYGDRMKWVLAEDNPPLLGFDENAWVARLDPQAMPMEEAVNLFVAHRQWMTHLLRRRPEADFSRTGRHSERGEISLAEMIVSMANHVDHHLRFLYGKRANLGLTLYPRYTHLPET